MKNAINQINLISDDGKCFNYYCFDRFVSEDGDTATIVKPRTYGNQSKSVYIFNGLRKFLNAKI